MSKSHGNDTKELVKGLLLQGATLSSVSEETGVPYQTIYTWSRNWGVGKNDGNRIPDETRVAIYNDWKSGMKQKDVAEKYGVQRNTVMQIRKEFGEEIGVKYGPEHHNWKGGTTEDVGGYILEKILPDDDMIEMAKSDRYVMQHRLVMARHLGRPLSPDETVHHINGDRQDNRIENLQLRRGNHGKGVKLVCRDCGSGNIKTDML